MDARSRGPASPDGLVVSTRVYEAVEYSTDMSDLNVTNCWPVGSVHQTSATIRGRYSGRYRT